MVVADGCRCRSKRAWSQPPAIRVTKVGHRCPGRLVSLFSAAGQRSAR